MIKIKIDNIVYEVPENMFNTLENYYFEILEY